MNSPFRSRGEKILQSKWKMTFCSILSSIQSVIAPGLVGCDEELGASRLFNFIFFSPDETEREKKKLSGLLNQDVRGWEGLLLPRWWHTGPCPVPWGHILACQREQSLFLHRDRGLCGGTSRQAAESWLQQCLGNRDHHPGAPQNIPAHPVGLQRTPSGCSNTVRSPHLQQLIFFIPIIFQF